MRKFLLSGFVFTALLLPFSGPAMAQGATVWDVADGGKSLTFEGTQMGQAFTGTFNDFGVDLAFDPAHLDSSRVTVTVEMASSTSGDAERDETVKSTEWFNVENFPQATFTAETFTHDHGDLYTAKGKLKIRDFEQDLALPFTYVATADSTPKSAKVTGQVVLRRLDYGLGAQNWKDADSIGHDVIVRFDLDLVEKQMAETPAEAGDKAAE